MTYLQKVTATINTLDRQMFLKIAGAVLGCFLIICGLLIYRYYHVTGTMRRKMVMINKQRTEAQKVLESFAQVNQQRTAVNTLLAQEKDFKIASAFETIINQLGLGNASITPPTSQQLENGYVEIVLTAQLQGINTYKLVQLLDVLEHNKRMYIKELNIDKQTGSNALNITITIATLTPGQEAEEAA
jgi:hypothetical protein